MSNDFISLRRLTLCLITVILTACSASTEGRPTAIPTDSVEKPSTVITSPTITETPAPLPTAVRTPPALPDIYISEHLNPIDVPRSYIEDTCEYLKNRWDPNNAAPGTVVMIIMFNNINRGAKPDSSDSITVIQFERLLENIKGQGFEAINTEQLADFLESNQYIPPRSVLLLQDGRRTAENFERHFRTPWEKWGWPVVNGWIIQTETPEPLWQENLALEQEGFVDHQLYSSLHRFSSVASEGFLSVELKKYIDIFEERYNKAPIAITWPGEPGINFPGAARGLGIRLGFTQNARGPVMYNWVPQADHEDLERPAYYPEVDYNDPLMTLPRYWPSQVLDNLDQVRLTGKEAIAYAKQNKEVELEYYNIVCAPEYGPIPRR
jgi:hypothetical protein